MVTFQVTPKGMPTDYHARAKRLILREAHANVQSDMILYNHSTNSYKAHEH